MTTDNQNLLTEYVQTASDAAFSELVTRYVDLVYSTALRLVQGDPHRAEDVAQTVFVDLARLARTFSLEVRLGGWLHRHTCFVAANLMRGERRRRSREMAAVETNLLQNSSEVDFSRVGPMLDEAINELGEADRTAILLRFFEQHDFRTVGQALGSNEDAARMRVTRALEKLANHLERRGITTTATSLSVVLSASAVQAAPIGLAATISAGVALVGTTLAPTATATSINTIAMTALQKTIVTATVAILAGAGIYEAHQASELREQTHVFQQQQARLSEQNQKLQLERDNATRLLAGLTDENERLNRNTDDLLRLRNEVSELRKLQKDLKNSSAMLNSQNSQIASTATETTPPAIIPKESWAFSGYATPEAALQSVACAMNRGDVKTFLASLTPEAQQMMEQQFSGKSPSELATNLHDEISGIEALRLDRKSDSAADEVTFVLFTKQEDNGATKVKDDAVLRFKNIGGEWKCAY